MKKKHPIKVCFVSFMGYPLYNKQIRSETFGGGAAVQVFILCKEITKNPDYDTYVMTGNYAYTRNKIEQRNNIKIINLRPIKRKITYYFLSLLNFFVELIRLNPDVVIQRGANKSTGICALYSRLFKKKFIFSIANITDVNGKAEKGVFGRLYKFGIKNAHYIVAQNKNQIIETTKRLKKSNNIELIRSSYVIKNKNFNNNKKYILWVSRAINWKRPELFLKLAKKLPEYDFLMICNKTDNKAKSIKYWESICTKASTISNLTFLEYVPFHEIDEYYRNAKLFVNTSIFEGFPNTFIQSFMNHTPVISLKVNPDNILTEYQIGVFCDNNFNKLTEKVQQLIEDKNKYERISQNCFKFAKKFYSIEENIKLWQKLIE